MKENLGESVANRDSKFISASHGGTGALCRKDLNGENAQDL